MDNSVIGKIGISAVTIYLGADGYLDPHLTYDDTIAMWDGSIFVYKTKEDFSSKKYDYRVPVQVKTEEVDAGVFPQETTYPISVVQLNNYYSDGGVVFFKVLVCGTKNQIYVSFLTKEKIRDILSDLKNDSQKTKTITLERVPKERNILLSNLGRVKLHQKHECIDLSILKNRTNYKLHISVTAKDKDLDIFEYLATHYVDMTVSLDNIPGIFVVKNGPVKVMTIAKVPSKISINGIVYYNEYTREYTQEGLVLRIGNSCTLKISYTTDPVIININLTLRSNTIAEIINDAKFLLSIVENKYIQFNNVKFPLKGLTEQDDAIQEWKGQLRFWTDVQSVFKALRVPQSLRINELSESDYKNLDTLVKAFIYNKPVYGNINDNSLHLFEIQNLKIAFLAQKIKDNKYQLYNVYDLAFAVTDELGDRHIIPTQSVLLGFEHLPSNLIAEDLFKDYKRLSRKDKKILIQANIDLLQLLNHYDRSNDDAIINIAFKMAQWLKNDKSGIIDAKVGLLNYLQTVKRKNKILTRAEMRVLGNMIPSNNIEQFGIYAVMGNIEEAKRCFDQLCESDKNLYMGMPIYHLLT